MDAISAELLSVSEPAGTSRAIIKTRRIIPVSIKLEVAKPKTATPKSATNNKRD
jgi:hypothetical protein